MVIQVSNAISYKTRRILYVAGVTIGVFGVVAGPLMEALNIPDPWVAVVVSFLGAVTTGTNMLARANTHSTGAPPESADDLEEPGMQWDDPVGALTDTD